MSSGTPSQGGIHELIGKALVDEDFRDLLYSDRPKALQGYTLSPDEHKALDAISRQEMETHAAKVSGGQKLIGIMMPAPQPPQDPQP